MVECGASGIGQRVEMMMDDESIGVNMDSGLCDQISNDILEMMERSCPFRMLPSVVVVIVSTRRPMERDEGLGSWQRVKPSMI